MSNWKEFERRVAKRTGGRRVAVADRETPLDVAHPYLGIECKYRKDFPALIKSGYNQALRGSKESDLIPTLVLGEFRNPLILGVVNIDDLVKILSHLHEALAEEGELPTRPELTD